MLEEKSGDEIKASVLSVVPEKTLNLIILSLYRREEATLQEISSYSVDHATEQKVITLDRMTARVKNGDNMFAKYRFLYNF